MHSCIVTVFAFLYFLYAVWHMLLCTYSFYIFMYFFTILHRNPPYFSYIFSSFIQSISGILLFSKNSKITCNKYI